MAVQVAYRHSKFTAAPDGLSTAEIWAVARKVRNQLVEDRFERRLLLDVAAERLSRLEANGIAFDVEWDLDHEVLNAAGNVRSTYRP